MQRIGVLGGTFDPIHNGHLAIAAEARWALGLEQVLCVVAAQQPLKRNGHAATALQRLEMVRSACTGEPAFIPCDIELRRPPPSYTVDTLRELQAGYPGGCELWFILGGDALAELPRWNNAPQLIAPARLAVVARPGAAPDLVELEQRLPGLREHCVLLEGPHLEISSTALRQRRASGRPLRYQVPDAVVAYIEEQGLYNAYSNEHID
jgi:nicotinate-nucleotide adenylyltransferase